MYSSAGARNQVIWDSFNLLAAHRYLETGGDHPSALDTEMGRLFAGLGKGANNAGIYAVADQEDVWDAIRAFFTQQAGEDAA